MASKKLPTLSDVVKKSNALLRCHWPVGSLWEPRLVALLASKIHIEDKDFQNYEISVRELAPEKKWGGKDYDELSLAVDRVMGRVITIYDDNGWTKYTVFNKCRFHRETGILELGFHADLKEHYLELNANFAKYSLAEFLKLPSIYSQRMFELLSSWKDKEEFIIPLDELHEIIDANISMRKNFSEFRIKVLKKAKKDIEEFTSLKFEWEAFKKGRSVVAVRFIFSENKRNVIASQKAVEEQKTQSSKNNEIWQKFRACFKNRGAACEGGHQDKSICDICLKFRN